jgi:hypothetical protein
MHVKRSHQTIRLRRLASHHQEYVARMHDTSDGGRATPQNRAFFYSNLLPDLDPAGPAFDAAITRMWTYIDAWAKSNGIGEDWYASMWRFPLRLDWAIAQRNHVRDNAAAFDHKYGGPGAGMKTFDVCYSQALAYAAVVSHSSNLVMVRDGTD